MTEAPARPAQDPRPRQPRTARSCASFGPLLQRIDPVVEELRAFTPETVGFFQNSADAAAPYDVNGHMIRIAAGLANTMPPSTASGGVVEPGECAPGLLAEPFHRFPGDARVRSVGRLRGQLHRRRRLMPDQLAKATAAIVAGLLVVVIGILVVTSRPPAGANEVVAEFDDAFPLIEGMYVRVDGAIAGSVGPIEVNDQGNAEVTLLLDESIEEPMARRPRRRSASRTRPATATSRSSRTRRGRIEPLGDDGLACEIDRRRRDAARRRWSRPRLDDLLNAFGEPERAGVKLILNELATALEQRGESIHDAAFELKPALESANTALAEVNEQNAALRSLITSAEDVTGQAAERSTELDRLINGLEATVVTTAEHGVALDASLERLPATASEARTTLAALTRAAVEGRPLAEEVATGAPELATAIERLPAFLDDAEATIDATKPTLELTRRLLKAALPSLIVGKDRVDHRCLRLHRRRVGPDQLGAGRHRRPRQRRRLPGPLRRRLLRRPRRGDALAARLRRRRRPARRTCRPTRPSTRTATSCACRRSSTAGSSGCRSSRAASPT